MIEESEAAEAAAIEAVESSRTAEPVSDLVVDTEPKPTETDDRSYEEIQEDKARSGGWRPIDEWDGKTEDWVDPRDFNARQGLIGDLRGYKRQVAGFATRIENLNQAHAGQMEILRKELIDARDEAIMEGGSHGLEIAKNKQFQIDSLSQQPAFTAPQGVDPVQAEWESRNSWINENTPRANHGKAIWAQLSEQGTHTPATAIPILEAEMAKAFPSSARSKPEVAETERGSKTRGFRRSSGKLTMSDLTREEQSMIDAMPGAWDGKTETEILQAVKDSRGAK